MADQEAIQKFKATLRGELLTPGEAEYDSAREVWNALIDRRPALIARCAAAAGVIRCVNFARDNKLGIAVRGGGHNVAGNAVCDGGMAGAVFMDWSERRTCAVGSCSHSDRH